MKINSVSLEFLARFQILMFPLGAPTSALQLKVSDWFTLITLGNTVNSVGCVAVINRYIHKDKLKESNMYYYQGTDRLEHNTAHLLKAYKNQIYIPQKV